MTLFLAVAALPWVLGVWARASAHSLDRFFTPRTAVVLIPVIALSLAVSTLASTGALASVLLSSGRPIAVVIGVAALCWPAWRSALTVGHVMRVVMNARRAARFGVHAPYAGATVVVEDDEPDAFAVPSGGGAVVVTTGLARSLSVDELSAVVAHERAHLRYHHTIWVQAAEVAARLCPLLNALVPHVRHAAERHADEVAAVLGRHTTMSAVATVALLCSQATRLSARASLGGSGGNAVRRVRALTEPPPRQRLTSVAMGVLVLLVIGIVSVALLDVVQDAVLPETGEAPTSVFR